MPIQPPKITGDPVVDSWSKDVTDNLNDLEVQFETQLEVTDVQSANYDGSTDLPSDLLEVSRSQSEITSLVGTQGYFLDASIGTMVTEDIMIRGTISAEAQQVSGGGGFTMDGKTGTAQFVSMNIRGGITSADVLADTLTLNPSKATLLSTTAIANGGYGWTNDGNLVTTAGYFGANEARLYQGVTDTYYSPSITTYATSGTVSQALIGGISAGSSYILEDIEFRLRSQTTGVPTSGSMSVTNIVVTIHNGFVTSGSVVATRNLANKTFNVADVDWGSGSNPFSDPFNLLTNASETFTGLSDQVDYGIRISFNWSITAGNNFTNAQAVITEVDGYSPLQRVSSDVVSIHGTVKEEPALRVVGGGGLHATSNLVWAGGTSLVSEDLEPDTTYVAMVHWADTAGANPTVNLALSAAVTFTTPKSQTDLLGVIQEGNTAAGQTPAVVGTVSSRGRHVCELLVFMDDVRVVNLIVNTNSADANFSSQQITAIYKKIGG